MLASPRPYIMAFYQKFASAPVAITDRKRKEMEEEPSDSAFEVAERRKMPLPAHRRVDSDQPAMFHPLGAEDNLKMLTALGLLPGAPASMDHSNDSPKSVSSDSLFGGNDGYFAPGHYPNIDPYGPQGNLAKAQEAASMDCDPSPSRHGPHCTGLPQLYVCHDFGSALYARCPSCNFSWEVRNSPGQSQTLSYSP